MYLPSDQPGAPAGEHDLVYFYDRTGSLAGCLPLARVKQLYARFSTASVHHSSLLPAPFADEVVLLLRRYRQRSKATVADRTVRLENHWALPSNVMSALQTVLGVDTEMFASPLNVHSATEQYCSVYSRDALFGATLDAYSRPWTGVVEFNPEYEAADMYKAVSAAITSAITASAPFVGVAVLPDWHRKAARHMYENHPHCHILAQVDQGFFNFRPASYSPALAPFDLTSLPPAAPGDAPRRPGNSSHARWPLHLVLVYNQAGLDALHARTATPTAWTALRQVLCSHASLVAAKRKNESPAAFAARVAKAVTVTPPPPGSLPSLPAPKRRWAHRWSAKNFATSLPTGASLPPVPPTRSPLDSPDTVPGVIMVPSLPLAHDPLSFTYTDASQQSAGESDVGSDIGCGVFSPFLSGPAREFYFRVPCSQSNIVRGELSAILHALLRLDPAPITPASISATVLTDSLTSLQLLHKHLHRPWLTASCPYQPLLQAIVDAAAALPQGVRIRKVRAHCGIRGNEAADALAKAGVTTDCTVDLPEPSCPDPTFFVYTPDSAPVSSTSPVLPSLQSPGAGGSPGRPGPDPPRHPC